MPDQRTGVPETPQAKRDSVWRRRLRLAGIVAGVTVLLLCTVAGLGWIYRTNLLEWTITAYLEGDDVTRVSSTVQAFETDHILIRNLKIGGKTPLTLARMRIDYTIDGIVTGEILQLRVHDLRSILGELPVEIDLIEGNGSFAGGPFEPTRFTSGLDLIRLRVGTHQFEPGRIDIDYKKDLLTLDAAITAPDGHVTLVSRGKLGASADPFQWRLSGRLNAALAEAISGGRLQSEGHAQFAISGEIRDLHALIDADKGQGVLDLPSTKGKIDFTLDKLVVDGLALPPTGEDTLTFDVTDAKIQQSGSKGTFDIILNIDRRDTPQIGFNKASLRLAGTLKRTGDRLDLHLSAAPLVRVRNLRLSQALPVQGDLNFSLLGDANDVTVDLDKGSVRHHLASRLTWKAGDVTLNSEGHLSDAADPVIFTLRGGFDATPLLALWPETKNARGSADIFIAGRVSQPILLKSDATDGASAWPGDVRLDAAIKLDTVELELPGLTAPDTSKDSIEIALKGFNGSSGHQQGKLVIAATLNRRRFAEIESERVRLNLEGRLTSDTRGYRFAPGFESTLAIENIRADNGLALPEGVIFQLTGTDNHITLTRDFSNIRHLLSFAHLEANGILKSNKRLKQPFRLTIPKLGSRSTEDSKYFAYVTGATIELPAKQLFVHGINASIEKINGGAKFGVEAADVRHKAQPPLTTPLSLSVKGRAEGDRIRATVSARQRYSPLKLRAVLKHDLAANTGRVDFSVPRFTLDPKTHTLADIYPPGAKLFDKTTGAASLKGHLLWDRDLLSGQMAVDIDKISLSSQGIKLSDLTGTVNFIELMPMSMPPRQRINGTVAFGDIGPLPLQLELQLREDGTIEIQDLDLKMAGGRMRTRGVIRPNRDETADAALLVQSVDLAELFQIIGIDGLDGTGRISGKVPIRVRGEAVTIDAGKLQADGSGTIRYSGTELQKQLSDRADTVGTVSQVLSDFRYKKLTLDLDKGADGNGAIMLRMEGANPAVYEGHPFAFNIRIESDFHKLGRIALGGVQAVTDLIMKSDKPSGVE